jgi:hypothetical protein
VKGYSLADAFVKNSQSERQYLTFCAGLVPGSKFRLRAPMVFKVINDSEQMCMAGTKILLYEKQCDFF